MRYYNFALYTNAEEIKEKAKINLNSYAYNVTVSTGGNYANAGGLAGRAECIVNSCAYNVTVSTPYNSDSLIDGLAGHIINNLVDSSEYNTTLIKFNSNSFISSSTTAEATSQIFDNEFFGYTVVDTAEKLHAALSANKNIILADDIDLTGVDWNTVSNYRGNFNGN